MDKKNADETKLLFDKLTPTQREVATALALGLTCGEIAQARSCSTKTVDTHRGAVLKKLGVRNGAELARLAIREGVTPL